MSNDKIGLILVQASISLAISINYQFSETKQQTGLEKHEGDCWLIS